MKVQKMRITEILKRILLFSASKIKSSESLSKQPTQLIVELISSLRQIIDSKLRNDYVAQSNSTIDEMIMMMILQNNFDKFSSSLFFSKIHF